MIGKRVKFIRKVSVEGFERKTDYVEGIILDKYLNRLTYQDNVVSFYLIQMDDGTLYHIPCSEICKVLS